MDLLTPFKSKVVIRKELPQNIDRENSLLLYDEVLDDLAEEYDGFARYLDSFPYQVGMKAGEKVKSFENFPNHLKKVLKAWPQPIKRSQNLVVLGGGSLGDFGGFVASILKRGVNLIHIPSTWLAALDSTHGGKTGLNYMGVKNQLGSFYPASHVYVVRDLLETTPDSIVEQAYGELIKMSLIGESHFFEDLVLEKRDPKDFFWRFLKNGIQDKYDVVLRDPFEKTKIRQTLNFGHSLGHALEAHFGWSHGDSVLQGIFFALKWSREKGILSKSLYSEIFDVITQKFDRVPATQLQWYKKPSSKKMAKLLEADKKLDANGRLNFVFLKRLGETVVRPVPLTDLLDEAKRQNWIK